jgi:hypothetical protein
MAYYDHSAVKAAFEAGAKIQWRGLPSFPVWRNTDVPVFATDLEYRIDPASIPAAPVAADFHPVDATIDDVVCEGNTFMDDESASNLPSRHQIGETVRVKDYAFGSDHVDWGTATVVGVRFTEGKVEYDIELHDPMCYDVDSCDVEAA